MAPKNTDDLARDSLNFRFTASCVADVVDTTGVLLGPLSVGRWLLHSKTACYWKRGASTLVATGVLVDESTPSVDNPIENGDYIPIDVTDATDNYVGAKLASGGSQGLLIAMKQAGPGT